MMHPIISTEALSFQKMLHYPDMAIEKNAVTFISGPSGCGKSTLLKLFNATLSPLTGCIRYKGTDISLINKITLRRAVLLVKQTPYLFPGTIYQNFLSYHTIQERACPDKESLRDYLSVCCMSAAWKTECRTLSGGERQRVFLSIALSLRPEVLLLDEPSSALDKELSVRVLDNIVRFAKQNRLTLVIISHDTDLQSSFAEHTITLR